MVSSPAVNARGAAFVLALCLAWAAVLARAQKPEPLPPPVFTATGTATLRTGSRAIALPFATTAEGTLVALEPLAIELGARLSATGGQGYALEIDGTSFLFGTTSTQLVTGQQILALSQRPAAQGSSILVPLDLLEKSLGERAGWVFQWDGERQELSAERPGTTEVEAAVEVVHLQGTTTLVVRFPASAPHYRIEQDGQTIDVRLLGGAFARGTAVPQAEDPLIRSLQLAGDRLRITLAPGVVAESYALEQPPFRLVFDLHRGALPGAAVPDLLPLPPRGGAATIVLDPGHGGAETGAVGKNGAVEKELTLALALEVERQLEAAAPVRVLLTRSKDVAVPFAERTAVANENRAELLISIHLNSSLGGRPFGAETYFLSLKASDRQAAAAAESENRFGGAAGDEAAGDLELILWDLAQSRHLADSQRLASFIQGELNAALGLKDRGVKQAPFAVLVGAEMPAVLVELGFLSNPDEEAKLQEPAHRTALAAALVRAIVRFRAGAAPPPGTGTEPEAPASPPSQGSSPDVAAGPVPAALTAGASRSRRHRRRRGLALASLATTLAAGLACRGSKEDEAPRITERGAYALPVDVYFPGADGLLHAERHEIETQGDAEGQLEAVVRLVLAGPESGELAAPFPEGVELAAAQLSAEGIAFIDLTSSRGGGIPPAGSTEEWQRVMSLVNSVSLNVSEVRRVVLLWNGVQPETFGGHFDATRPFAPDLSLLARRPGEADGTR